MVYVIQSESKGLTTRGLLFCFLGSKCLMSKVRKKWTSQLRRGNSSLFSLSLGSSGLDDATQAQWWGLIFFTPMLISPPETPSQAYPEIMLYHLSGYPLLNLSPLKLTDKINHHSNHYTISCGKT